MNVCVYAASSPELDGRLYEAAFELGAELARGGDTLVFGAGAGGLMGECARGAESLGGEIIGIAPGYFNKPGVLFEHCTELIITDTMAERKVKMGELSEGYIALPGGLGTYDELFETLALKQVGRLNAPIALINALGSYDALLKLLESAADGGFMGRDCLELCSAFETPLSALKHVRESAGAPSESNTQNYIR